MVIRLYLSCCGGDKAIAAVEAAVKQAGVPAQIEVVEDLVAMARAGVMSTPAVEIDGRLVASGSVPRVADLANLLAQAAR